MYLQARKKNVLSVYVKKFPEILDCFKLPKIF